MLGDVIFKYPFVLYFLAVLPVMAMWYWKKHKKSTPDITYSSLQVFANIRPTLRERLYHLPAVLRTLAVGLLIIALARPQSFSTGEDVYTEGIDVAMTRHNGLVTAD